MATTKPTKRKLPKIKTTSQEKIENEEYAKSLEKEIQNKLEGTIKMLTTQIEKTCENILENLGQTSNRIHQITNITRHIHFMHKHGFLRGHYYSECENQDCIDNKKECEIDLGCLYPNIVPFIRILYSEYLTMEDQDGNGLIFFKDFYIDYLDPTVPLGIKSLLYNIYFPDTIRYPYRDKNGNLIKSSTKTIDYNFKWDGKIFSHSTINRTTRLRRFTWQQYLSTIDDLISGG